MIVRIKPTIPKFKRPKMPKIPKLGTAVVTSIALIVFGLFLWAQQPVNVANTPAVTQSAGPWTMNTTQWASGTLGAMANYGTSPGAVLTPGVNAFITNSPAVSFAPSSASSVALTRFHNSSAAAVNVKSSAGNLYGLVLGNSGSIPCWLQVMNTASTPTAGTSVLDSYMVQAGVTLAVNPGSFALTNYTTGIGVAGATTDSGATTTGCTTTFSVTLYVQ